MSNEPPEPPRKVTPYRPGKRVSTFRRLDIDFAGTALEQALAERDRLEQEKGVPTSASEPEIEPVPTRSNPPQLAAVPPSTPVSETQSGGYIKGSTGGYKDEVVATRVATIQPLVATRVATTQPGGYTPGSNPERLSNRSKDRHRYEQREQYNIRLEKNKAQKINELCADLKLTKQEFWDLVATRIVELVATDVATLGLMFKGLVATSVAHDDMMIFTTCDDIISRYARYARQKWNRRDDREGQKYNSTDIRLIEIALIATVEKKLRGNTAKQPIKSFNYFTAEIDALVAQHEAGELPANLDEYHRYVLTTWEKRIKPLRDAKWGLHEGSEP